MSFGIAYNVKSKVRVCTPELFHRAIDSQVVADVCAQIKDALEAVRRGEMSAEDFETLKGNLKKALIIFTFHATFKNGRRKNDEAVPSGLSIYDLDHIPNPEGRWKEIEPRKEELATPYTIVYQEYDNGTAFLMNFNDYRVTVEFKGRTYTIEAYGYIVLNRAA